MLCMSCEFGCLSLHIFKNVKSTMWNQTKITCLWQWPLANAWKKWQETRSRQPYILSAFGLFRELLDRGCIDVQHPSTNLSFMNLFLNLLIIQTTTLFSDNLFYSLIPAVQKSTAFCLFWSFYLLIFLSTFSSSEILHPAQNFASDR